jgi:hypothetical protein
MVLCCLKFRKQKGHDYINNENEGCPEKRDELLKEIFDFL